jgi:glycosyltransferase 2 family protein
MPRKRLWVVLQVAFVVAVLWFAGRALVGQWSGVQALLATAHPNWPQLGAATLLVVAAYALLIQVWRSVLSAWHGEAERGISFREAGRIWFVSNLGRYVPGKVWQIATMGVMAQRRGVSPVSATGAALMVNLANVASGFVVVLATGATVFRTFAHAGPRAGLLLAIVLALGLALLPAALAWISPRLARLTKQRVTLPPIPTRAVWLAALGTAAAWVVYGLAFQLFAASLVHRPTGATTFYIAAYTGSYLVGYLALFAPGGLVVREYMLVASLTSLGVLTAPEAWLVAIASRLWLTVLEVLPGLVYLLVPGERP